jgi:DNA-binding response OmpR family regulator
MRILFVESDTDIRYVVAGARADEGFEVLVAANGEKPLQS